MKVQVRVKWLQKIFAQVLIVQWWVSLHQILYPLLMVANFSSHMEVVLNDMKFNILEPNELARKCYNKYNNVRILSITTEKSRKWFSHNTNSNIQIFVLKFNLPATYDACTVLQTPQSLTPLSNQLLPIFLNNVGTGKKIMIPISSKNYSK